MLRAKYSVALMLIGLIACGCKPSGPTNPLPTTQPVSASVPSGPDVPYPQFENWNQFAVGTKIVRRKEVTNPNGHVFETETLKLIDKNDKKVVVESQTLVERSTGVNDDNPPQLFTFPATFKLPASMTIEQFRLPSLKAELKGEEPIEIAGQTYQAKVYEWIESNETGPMNVRLLWADNFPGGKVYQEMLTQQTSMRSIEKITQAEIAKP